MLYQTIRENNQEPIHPSIVQSFIQVQLLSEPFPQLLCDIYIQQQKNYFWATFKILMFSVTNQYFKSLKPVQQLCRQTVSGVRSLFG